MKSNQVEFEHVMQGLQESHKESPIEKMFIWTRKEDESEDRFYLQLNKMELIGLMEFIKNELLTDEGEEE